MIFPSKLLQQDEQPIVDPSSAEGKIMEGDNFQNNGGKDQSICNVFLMKSLAPVTEGFACIPHGKSWMAKLKKKRFSALFFILTYYYKRIAKNFKTSYVHIQCTQKALWMAKVPILHWGGVGGTSMVCWTHNAYFVPYAMVFISTVPKI